MRASRCLAAILIALTVPGCQSAVAFGPDLQIRGDGAEAIELGRMLNAVKAETVADIGAGSGGFTALIVEQLGSKVRVIATELPAQVPKLSEGLQSHGASAVTIVEGAPAETNLRAGSCDALIVRLTYHHFDRPAEMAASLFRTVRSGGRVFVVELPRTQNYKGEWDGIMPSALIAQLQKVGFVHERTVDQFDTMWRPPLYLMVVRKP